MDAAPRERPGWLTTLAILNLVFGALSLFFALGTLKDPTAGSRSIGDTPTGLGATEAAALHDAEGAARLVMDRHALPLRVKAVASAVAALAFLYAAAMALSLDPAGRRANLTAAALGVANQVVNLMVSLPLAQELAVATAPAFSRIAATHSSSVSVPDAHGPLALLFTAIPVVTAVLAVTYSSILFAAFGGRRGAALYGLQSPVDNGHGGPPTQAA